MITDTETDYTPHGREDVRVRAEAFATYLLGMMTPEQRDALTEQQLADFKWGIEQGFVTGYEACVEKMTGTHRPTLEAARDGREIATKAIETAPSATARAYTADTLYKAFARRSEDLARLSDENPVVASMIRDMAVGILMVCRRRGIDPAHAKTTAIISPEDRIIVSIQR